MPSSSDTNTLFSPRFSLTSTQLSTRLTALLSPNGVMGVVDFYVQSRVDVSFRNYTGGLIDRHVNFLGRTFWRAWFDVDRVALEPGRRDYLEYRFGTVLVRQLPKRYLGLDSVLHLARLSQEAFLLDQSPPRDRGAD